MPQSDEKNLISIDDVIFWAKKSGVDFGKGDPRERLRYLTKIGLLPHAKRKSFNGNPPNGAYPEYVIGLLKEIDEKIKSGKTIQELKKEKERKDFVDVSYEYAFPHKKYLSIHPAAAAAEISRPEKKDSEKEPVVVSAFFGKKIFSALKIFISIFIFTGIVFLLAGPVFNTLDSFPHLAAVQSIRKDFHSFLLASFGWTQRFAQAPAIPLEEVSEMKEIFFPPRPEPYLTINAETDINSPLNVRDKITAPSLALSSNDFEGVLVSAGLTSDRTYTFPNLSGVVCLTTGNCIGIGREIFSLEDGIPNRLTKFLSSDEIGISSIEDFYPGVALTISSDGRIGIGLNSPVYPLHVEGRIQATGDICTDLMGGRCLSTLPIGAAGRGGGGIGGFGISGYLPIWIGAASLGNSLIYQSGGNLGIGTTAPAQALDVAGTIRVLGFQLPTGANENYVLTSNAEGIASWQPAPPVTVPGETGQTLRYDGVEWVGNHFIHNTGTAVGIGTTTTLASLTLSGNAVFLTTSLPQLSLRYDNDNYLNFEINGEQALLEASKRLVLNSLTGEIRIGNNVNIFDAFGAEIRGDTFISTTTDSTVRKSGELVFRANLPIFRFPMAAQTTSTGNVIVSKVFSPTDSLDLIAPPRLPGTDRVYAFLINFADNIDTTASSSWRVYRPIAATTTFAFEFPGQNLISLETGNSHLTDIVVLPDNDWQLETSLPSSERSIRIFNIFLLVFDRIN